MSDDLVKRLRNHIAVVINNRGHVFEAETLCDEAADRIEELEAELRNMALDCLAAKGQAAEAYQAQLAAEAKAVDAMEEVATYSNDPHLVKWSRTTLAELKGTDT